MGGSEKYLNEFIIACWDFSGPKIGPRILKVYLIGCPQPAAEDRALSASDSGTAIRIKTTSNKAIEDESATTTLIP